MIEARNGAEAAEHDLLSVRRAAGIFRVYMKRVAIAGGFAEKRKILLRERNDSFKRGYWAAHRFPKYGVWSGETSKSFART